MGRKLQIYLVEKPSQGRVGAAIECLHTYLRIHTFTGFNVWLLILLFFFEVSSIGLLVSRSDILYICEHAHLSHV
jgi:hypothetical protein